MKRLAAIAAAVAVALALPACGDEGNDSEFPVVEQRREERETERNEAIICSLSESEAEARGPEDYETWLIVCD